MFSHVHKKCQTIHQLDIIKKQRRLQRKAHESYPIFYEEEKGKKRQYGHERYKRLSEHRKQRLAECKKKIIKTLSNNSEWLGHASLF